MEWGSEGRGFKSRRPECVKTKPHTDFRCGALHAVVVRRGDAGLTSYLLNFEVTPAFFRSTRPASSDPERRPHARARTRNRAPGFSCTQSISRQRASPSFIPPVSAISFSTALHSRRKAGGCSAVKIRCLVYSGHAIRWRASIDGHEMLTGAASELMALRLEQSGVTLWLQFVNGQYTIP